MRNREDERAHPGNDIASFLAEYHVVYPNQRAIDETVDVVLMHMPRRINIISKAIDTLQKLTRASAFEAHYVHPAYWVLIVLLYVGGLAAVQRDMANAYVTALYLAPTPLLFGMTVLFRSRDHGVAELEAACKYAAHQVLLAKFLLVAVVNAMADLVLIVGIHSFSNTTALTNLFMLCLWPSLLLSAISFVVSANTKSIHVVVITMALWTALAALCAQSPPLMQFIVSTSVEICIPAACVFLLALGWQVLQMKRRMTHAVVH